jgi:hypothetical protein
VTASTVLTPLGCPPPWAVSTATRAAASRTSARHVSLRLPLVVAGDWFWELVEADEQEDPASKPATDDSYAWAVALVPALLVLQLVATDLMRIAVPGFVLFAELLLLCVAFACVDAARLRAAGLDAPSPLAALLPPLYLFQRYGLTRDPVLPVAWLVVAAGATLLSLVVDARLAPVSLPSQQVEARLYEQLFQGRLPLDAQTATISCPAFTARWVGQEFRCTGTDRERSVPLEVSVVDRTGALATQSLEAAH